VLKSITQVKEDDLMVYEVTNKTIDRSTNHRWAPKSSWVSEL